MSPLLMVVACTLRVLTGFFSAVPVTGERALLQGQMPPGSPPGGLFVSVAVCVADAAAVRAAEGRAMLTGESGGRERERDNGGE